MDRIRPIVSQLIQENNFFFFSLFCVTSFISSYLIHNTFFNEELFYNTFGEQLNLERIHKLLELGSRYRIINYLFIPVALILKILYNSFWVSIGSFLRIGKDNFGSNFSVCLKAEIVFFVMILVNLIVLFFFKDVNTLNDLRPVPFSLLEIYKSNEIPKWLQYPLQTANIWEVFYCLTGTLIYSYKNNIDYKNSLYIFCIPYLIGLAIWIILVMFIGLQFS